MNFIGLREWLDCDNQKMRRQKRIEYVKMRKAYKVAVSRANRKFKERKYHELNGLLSNPRRWWRYVSAEDEGDE